MRKKMKRTGISREMAEDIFESGEEEGHLYNAEPEAVVEGELSYWTE